MLWNPQRKPQLRPIEAFPIAEDDGRPMIGLRDPTGLSETVLGLSVEALQIIALMDGQLTCEQIRIAFARNTGFSLGIVTLQELMAALDKAHFLEGGSFEALYKKLADEYHAAPTRPMRNASALGVVVESREPFCSILADAPHAHSAGITGLVQGIIAPHLDYTRGRPCYAAAYATLIDRPAPHRIIILGTNHFGRSTSVVSTGKAFATPLGTTEVDVPFLEKIEARTGDLRRLEMDHAREHSVELQVLWLQHLFGADRFRMVPFLCPDPSEPGCPQPGPFRSVRPPCRSGMGRSSGSAGPCNPQPGPSRPQLSPSDPTQTAPSDGKGVDLRDFAHTLRELVEEDGHDTLLVAGADLSHVGMHFGDPQTLDEAFLEEVRQRDRRALDAIEAADAEAFRNCVSAEGNPTRVCSAGCIFTLLTALPHASPRMLGYHQAVDQSTQTGVTCAAFVLTGEKQRMSAK